MTDCLFCKIVHGDINAEIVYSDTSTLAFRDINPQAPEHILVIPRAHFASIHEIPESRKDIIPGITDTAVKIIKDLGLDKQGYRLVMNYGEKGGQTVPHIHLHILSGRSLTWPPG
ncbi:MAG: histidine triad nucleotide-binding protein [Chitinivibrionales bacterium]